MALKCYLPAEIVIARNVNLSYFGFEISYSSISIGKFHAVFLSMSCIKALIHFIKNAIINKYFDYDGGPDSGSSSSNDNTTPFKKGENLTTSFSKKDGEVSTSSGKEGGNSTTSSGKEGGNSTTSSGKEGGNSTTSTTQNTTKGGGSSVASSSKIEESDTYTRVITYSDYECDSSDSDLHANYEDSSEDDGESYTSKVVNSNVEKFEKSIEDMNSEGLMETMRTIKIMQSEYSKGKSPNASDQIEQLSIKEALCMEAFNKRINEEEVSKIEASSKGKGKEK